MVPSGKDLPVKNKIIVKNIMFSSVIKSVNEPGSSNLCGDYSECANCNKCKYCERAKN